MGDITESRRDGKTVAGGGAQRNPRNGENDRGSPGGTVTTHILPSFEWRSLLRPAKEYQQQDARRAMRPFRPDKKRRARSEGQPGRFKRPSATPGSARTSLHPRLLSCHHSVVRRRGFGVGSRPSKFQISLARISGFKCFAGRLEISDFGCGLGALPRGDFKFQISGFRCGSGALSRGDFRFQISNALQISDADQRRF